jgi:hypothetical protein
MKSPSHFHLGAAKKVIHSRYYGAWNQIWLNFSVLW